MVRQDIRDGVLEVVNEQSLQALLEHSPRLKYLFIMSCELSCATRMSHEIPTSTLMFAGARHLIRVLDSDDRDRDRLRAQHSTLFNA